MGSDFPFQQGARILFQGDSITDAGRDYANAGDLGQGYPRYVAAWFTQNRPELGLTFLNRGISGNRVYDLESRWTEDCVALQPDLVSIMIGINDTWRRYDSNVLSPVDEFETSLRRILDRVKNETAAKLLILEPYVLPTPADRLTWREDLDPRREAVGRVAREYQATFIPLDAIMNQAARERTPEYWAEDGVHPTAAGHQFIAEQWIEAVQR